MSRLRRVQTGRQSPQQVCLEEELERQYCRQEQSEHQLVRKHHLQLGLKWMSTVKEIDEAS